LLKKIIAIPDIQAPKYDKQALQTALNIIRGEKPDVLIFIGDVVDLQSVSRFQPLSWEEARQTTDMEIAAANAVLDQFDKVIPRKTEKIFLEGNHDRRLELWFTQYAPKLGEDFTGNNIQARIQVRPRCRTTLSYRKGRLCAWVVYE